jgi:hypothetical protein
MPQSEARVTLLGVLGVDGFSNSKRPQASSVSRCTSGVYVTTLTPEGVTLTSYKKLDNKTLKYYTFTRLKSLLYLISERT